MLQVGVAAFDLRSASLHLSQYIETSCSYQNTKTLLHFYDPNTVIVPPNKTAADGMVGVSELVDKNYQASKKVILLWHFIYILQKERIIAFYSKKSSLCRSQWHVVALMIPRYYVLFSLTGTSILSVIGWIRPLNITHVPFICKGAVMVKNLSARDPSALGLDTYCKQYYLCLAAASATIKW